MPTLLDCPLCGRDVANDQTITRARGKWVCTACCTGDGPPVGDLVVVNRLYFYVTVRDGARFGLLMGPYDSYDEAAANVDRGRRIANRLDPRTVFAGFGVAGSNGRYAGRVALAEWDHEPRGA